jgi:hypothetical protein
VFEGYILEAGCYIPASLERYILFVAL